MRNMKLEERIRTALDNLISGETSTHDTEMIIIDIIDDEREESRKWTLEDIVTILKHGR